MNNKLTIYTAAFLMVSGSLLSQVITPPGDREHLVNRMNLVLSNTSREPGQFSDVHSPFVKVETPKPVVREQVDTISVQTEQSPEILPDQVALRIISQQFKPMGSLILGSRGLLQLANGRTIESGKSFSADIQGTSYEVTVEEVRESGYILRLGSARITQSFQSKPKKPSE